MRAKYPSIEIIIRKRLRGNHVSKTVYEMSEAKVSIKNNEIVLIGTLGPSPAQISVRQEE